MGGGDEEGVGDPGFVFGSLRQRSPVRLVESAVGAEYAAHAASVFGAVHHLTKRGLWPPLQECPSYSLRRGSARRRPRRVIGFAKPHIIVSDVVGRLLQHASARVVIFPVRLLSQPPAVPPPPPLFWSHYNQGPRAMETRVAAR